MGFGTGLTPENCGFTLQNRGAGFSLDPSHPNALEPNKRPYHTIIPAMLTHADTEELYATFSNMGGFMQPQGHMQLAVHLLANKLDPQVCVFITISCVLAHTAKLSCRLFYVAPNRLPLIRLDSASLMAQKMVSYTSKRAFTGILFPN